MTRRDGKFYSIIGFISAIILTIVLCLVLMLTGVINIDKPNTLIIESGSAYKKYDGEPLYCETWELKNGILQEGHKLIVTPYSSFVGSPTGLSFTQNKFNVEIIDERNNNKDVSAEYLIQKKFGLLVVGDLDYFDDFESLMDADMTSIETPKGKQFQQLLNQLKDESGFEVNDLSDMLNGENMETPYLNIKSEKGGTVYLRQESFGNYNGHGFDKPQPYDVGEGKTPLNYSANAFNAFRQKTGQIFTLDSHIEIELLIGNFYYLPYYSYDNLNSFDDIKIYEKATSYSANVGLYNYIADATDFSELEERTEEINYRQFVKDNYLAIDENLKNQLIEFAGNSFDGLSDRQLINAIAQFVQKSAKYNLEFAPFPEGKDMVLYFLKESKEGICQHYAAAGTMLYRAFGIPARFTTGFLAKDLIANESTAVKGKDGHAWVEVYVDNVGWMQVEVTGGFESQKPALPEIPPIELIIKTATAIKEYDGEPLQKAEWQIISGRLKTGHSLIATEIDGQTPSSIITPQQIDNEGFGYMIVDGEGNDVSSEYQIVVSEEKGKLIVDKIAINIQTETNRFEFDGQKKKAQENTAFSLTGQQPMSFNQMREYLLEKYSHSLEIGTYEGVGPDLGEYDNSIPYIVMAEIEGEQQNITNTFYNFIYNYGKITIAEKILEVQTHSIIRTYDGTAHYSEGFDIPQYIKDNGFEIVLDTSAENYRTEVIDVTDQYGVINELKFKIFDGTTDITNKFSISCLGTIIVKPREIKIRTASAEKTYDGEELSRYQPSDYSIPFGELLDGHKLKLDETNIPSITDAGEINNTLQFKILSQDESIDYSSNYSISYSTLGTLTINPIQITINTVGKTEIFVGQILKNEQLENPTIEQIENRLLDGYSVEFTDWASLAEVGEIDNTVTLTFYKNGEITNNYAATYGTIGKLVLYSGGQGFDVDKEKFNPSTAPILKITSSKAGTIYLRQNSYGDYNYKGNGFSAPERYPVGQGDISPLFFAGNAISEIYPNNDLESNIRIEFIDKNQIYALPYYTPYQNINSIDDFRLYGDTSTAYTTQSILFNYLGDINTSGIPDDYMELNYRQFVKDIYLNIDDQLKAELLALTAGEFENTSGWTKINKIAKYVQNSATYNLNFADFPSDKDMILHFLKDGKEGICQHFAMAATMIYRAYGIPARFVTGYFVQNAIANQQMTVTGESAHAWVEVYVDKIGWMQVEVTGGGGFAPSYESRKIEIVTGDAEAKYNQSGIYFGKDGLTCTDWDYKEDSVGRLYTTHELVIIESTAHKEIGKVDNEFISYKVVDQEGNDVSYLYEIHIENGTLWLYRDTIKISTESKTAKYENGKTLSTNGDFSYSPQLLDGYKFKVEEYSILDHVGKMKNKILLSIYDEYNNDRDVSDEYKLEDDRIGTLWLYECDIYVTTYSLTEEYSGKAISNYEYGTGYSYNGDLQYSPILEVSSYATITDVGKTSNFIKVKIVSDNKGGNISDRYYIHYQYGTLEVTQKSIRIEVDGTFIEANDDLQGFETLPEQEQQAIIDSAQITGLNADHKVNLTLSSELIANGATQIIVNYNIVDKQGKDVTKNYSAIILSGYIVVG